MAIISSHVLDSVDGTHASGVSVSLNNLTTGATLFETKTDDGGRLVETLDLSTASPADQYELVFRIDQFWSAKKLPRKGAQTTDQVVLRFMMADPDARYHMPIILSPNGYSVWWSEPES